MHIYYILNILEAHLNLLCGSVCNASCQYHKLPTGATTFMLIVYDSARALLPRNVTMPETILLGVSTNYE